jgi:hypothetical protein
MGLSIFEYVSRNTPNPALTDGYLKPNDYDLLSRRRIPIRAWCSTRGATAIIRGRAAASRFSRARGWHCASTGVHIRARARRAAYATSGIAIHVAIYVAIHIAIHISAAIRSNRVLSAWGGGCRAGSRAAYRTRTTIRSAIDTNRKRAGAN